ncbi:MAG: hypothetical protein K0R80_2460 [Clostridia bacterium]|jgi:hypothetical protein|nr:hypothetical protein [Clostridia bacterium]MDF2892093.1 hypothetical protein [Clostridia bacterium]
MPFVSVVNHLFEKEDKKQDEKDTNKNKKDEKDTKQNER